MKRHLHWCVDMSIRTLWIPGIPNSHRQPCSLKISLVPGLYFARPRLARYMTVWTRRLLLHLITQAPFENGRHASDIYLSYLTIFRSYLHKLWALIDEIQGHISMSINVRVTFWYPILHSLSIYFLGSTKASTSLMVPNITFYTPSLAENPFIWSSN
jgi:hypothetical protein